MFPKLRGRIVEKLGSAQVCAEIIGIDPGTLSNKMHGHANFTYKEIRALCQLLDIKQQEVGEFFNIGK